MKKIINGKLYNTETAKSIGYWSNGSNSRDFNYIEKELFLKKTGEYFLYAYGGANTHYAVSCGTNEWCGNEVIEPLSENEAKKWAEKHLTADEYISIFGEVEE